MTARVRLFASLPPNAIRPFVVRRLLRITAEAFGARRPAVRWMRGDRPLRLYAESSGAFASALLEGGGDVAAVRRALWERARAVGQTLRRLLGIRTDDDAMRAASIVYRVLGIDLRAVEPGRIVVTRCAFAQRYRPDVCALMSALDDGLFAGLTGGRRLTFARRLTEGAPACVASLSPRQGRAA
jgi:hypothetical protein